MAQSVWTGGSHHTGLAALPHENIQYEDAIFYAKKSMKKILESGSAKGISGELYEIAWNERERKAKPEIYQKKYFQALKFAILFQEREFIIFLKQREQEYKK